LTLGLGVLFEDEIVAVAGGAAGRVGLHGHDDRGIVLADPDGRSVVPARTKPRPI